MLIVILTWLTSSIGKVVAKWGAIAAAEREKINDQVSKLPNDDELARWVRHDD